MEILTREQLLEARQAAKRYLRFTVPLPAIGEARALEGVQIPSGLDAREDDLVMTGIGVPWDTETELWPGVTESFARGAFADAMKDVRWMIQHRGLALARQGAGTMVLSEQDPDGLRYFSAMDPRDQDAVTLGAKVERGAVNGASIGFTLRGGEEELIHKEDGTHHYRVTKCGELFEVSAVTFPQYEDTSVQLANRSRFRDAFEPIPRALPVDPTPAPEIPAGHADRLARKRRERREDRIRIARAAAN